jgi:hypothetical protein
VVLRRLGKYWRSLTADKRAGQVSVDAHNMNARDKEDFTGKLKIKKPAIEIYYALEFPY